jgi:alkanesulfonate monooxygenase
MTNPPRFGVWTSVHGTWASFHHPEDPVDSSWERNKAYILRAEELGYDSTLVAQHMINVIGEDIDQLDAWTACAGLAALTSKIEIIAAIKPSLLHPVPTAKMALGVEEISEGRFAINLVNAWYKPELLRAGIGFREHDERYAYGAEWLRVFRSLVSGETVNYHGEYFDIEEYFLRPASRTRERMPIYAGGESPPARDLVADQVDTWFFNGQPREDIQALIDDVRSRPRGAGLAPLQFGLAAFVIARETEEEAQAEFDYAWKLKERDAEERQSHEFTMYANADQKAQMWQTFRKNPHIGTNGGTAAGLVGSYDQVAEVIREWNEIGIELFMLQFQPMEAKMERFAAEVMPRVRKEAASVA